MSGVRGKREAGIKEYVWVQNCLEVAATCLVYRKEVGLCCLH